MSVLSGFEVEAVASSFALLLEASSTFGGSHTASPHGAPLGGFHFTLDGASGDEGSDAMLLSCGFII